MTTTDTTARAFSAVGSIIEYKGEDPRQSTATLYLLARDEGDERDWEEGDDDVRPVIRFTGANGQMAILAADGSVIADDEESVKETDRIDAALRESYGLSDERLEHIKHAAAALAQAFVLASMGLPAEIVEASLRVAGGVKPV